MENDREVQSHVAEAESALAKAMQVARAASGEAGSAQRTRSVAVIRDIERALHALSGIRRIGGIDLTDEDLMGSEERKKVREARAVARDEKTQRARRSA